MAQRGRPRKRQPQEPQEPQAEAAEQKPRKRRKREPLNGLKLKLSAPQRPGYHRHWINDEESRIQEVQNRDYEFVENEDISSDGSNSRVCRLAGTKEDGSPKYAYLMEIPEEWYQEDQAEKQEPLDEFEKAIEEGQAGRREGDNLEATPRGRPQGGRVVTST